MNEWRPIESFPGYAVSDGGSVRNEETGKIMSLLVNQNGIVNVSMMRKQVQYKRAVSHLVASAFIDRPQPSFITPINLDGDRRNNQARNLVWRPRWFAVKYVRQFYTASVSFPNPIEDMDTHQEFASSWEATIRFGLLDLEVLTAMIHNIYVWPTFQRFRAIS